MCVANTSLIERCRLLALKLPISDLYGLFQKLFKPLGTSSKHYQLCYSNISHHTFSKCSTFSFRLFSLLFFIAEGFSEKIGILKNKLCSDIFLSFVEHILPPVIAENRVTMTDSAAATTMLKGASSNQNSTHCSCFLPPLAHAHLCQNSVGLC